MIKLYSILATLALAGSALAGTAPCATCTAPAPVGAYANTLFAGYDFRQESYYLHAGLMHDLNGNMGDGGLFLRAFTGFGSYNYDTIPGAPHVTGQLFDSDLGVGYRVPVGQWMLGAYVGAHVRDRNLTAIDPANNNIGTDWGARAILDVYGNVGPFTVMAMGQYSTIENAIWSRARVGYNICEKFRFGPEFIYLNDAQFDERRVGGFLTFQTCPKSNLTLATGYSNYGSSTGGGGNSMYGTVEFSLNF